MFKERFLFGPFGEKSPLIILALVLLLVTSLPKFAPCEEVGAEEQKKVVRQVAQKWIQVGTEQYNRSFFTAAEQSFLRAKEYEGYLDAADRKKLTGLIEQTHIAVLERAYSNGGPISSARRTTKGQSSSRKGQRQ